MKRILTITMLTIVLPTAIKADQPQTTGHKVKVAAQAVGHDIKETAQVVAQGIKSGIYSAKEKVNTIFERIAKETRTALKKTNTNNGKSWQLLKEHVTTTHRDCAQLSSYAHQLDAENQFLDKLEQELTTNNISNEPARTAIKEAKELTSKAKKLVDTARAEIEDTLKKLHATTEKHQVALTHATSEANAKGQDASDLVYDALVEVKSK